MFRYLKLFILLVITGCGYSSVSLDTPPTINPDKLQIFTVPSKLDIIKALNVIIYELDKDGIYTKKQMVDVINAVHFENHDSCKASEHNLYIVFTEGQWSATDKKYCVFAVYTKELKGICHYGLFDGDHKVTMVHKGKIYKSAFAHEILHYFRKYIDGKTGHEPKHSGMFK